jgi:N,N'-diacetyllegionaminate synthase
MRIGHVNLDEQVLVVAEIGNNHEGKFDVAKELVRKAAECGVGAVKFQTFRTKYFVGSHDKARYDRLRSFELSYRQFEELQQLAKSLGLLFLATPLDLESAKFLEALVDCYKIASGDNNLYPLLEVVCQTGKPVVISSGLSDLAQIAKSKQFVEDQWRTRGLVQQVMVLHCVSSYPVPPDQANLAAIPFLADRLRCPVGYSDHTFGTEACIMAAALGARVVEKHFTLDKNYSDFRDHHLSADPAEMKQLVQQLERIRTLRGKAEKVVQPCEAALVSQARRSIVAASDLPRGHRLKRQDLTWIRPAVGLPPGDEGKLLGKKLKRHLSFGEPVLPHDVE